MKVEVIWHKPLYLQNGSNQNLIYKLPSNSTLPRKPGIYIFARRHGKVYPLYIGKGQNLKLRVDGELNNVRLMTGIQNGKTGQKILLYCTVKPSRGQQIDKALKVVEDGFIEYAVEKGYEIFNNKGAKRPYNTICTKIKSRTNPFPKKLKAIPR